ncbi:hypothetical protein ACFVHB_27325 [Kitasatospora sp. NPDC127111]|uniref:hypothetical protein n=1 Tax=Kitasatospora sp. NPDC127111 TaxID=3345363 RepID=UPI0036417A44
MRSTPVRLSRWLAAPAAAVCLALSGAAVAAPASSAPASPAALRPLPVPDTRYCAAVVGHVPGADGRGPLLGHGCSTDSRVDAPAHADGAANRPADRRLLLAE